jgi:hypothetical protein
MALEDLICVVRMRGFVEHRQLRSPVDCHAHYRDRDQQEGERDGKQPPQRLAKRLTPGRILGKNCRGRVSALAHPASGIYACGPRDVDRGALNRFSFTRYRCLYQSAPILQLELA